eukprot:506127-Amphidinium_carterae.1
MSVCDSAAESGTLGKVRVLCWNVRVAHLDELTKALSTELDWDVLLLQEVCRSSTKLGAHTSAGHAVYASSPHDGRRQSAVVINVNFAGDIHAERVGSHSVAVKIGWQKQAIWFMSSHLCPYNSLAEYKWDLDEALSLVPALGGQDKCVWGVDAQTPLTSSGEAQHGDAIGTSVSNVPDVKAPLFVDAVRELGLVLANTFLPVADDIATCYYDGRHEPRQIDFVGVSLDLYGRSQTMMWHSCATNSDHRAIVVDLLGGTKQRRRYTRPLPVHWQRTSALYPMIVSDALGVTVDTTAPSSKFERSWHVWCDGGASWHKCGRHRRITGAGWGYCVFPFGLAVPSISDIAIVKRCGP